MSSDIINLTAAAGAKVINYTDALNGTPLNYLTGTNSGRNSDQDNVAGLTALLVEDLGATAWKLFLSTNDGVSYGSPLTISGITAGSIPRVAVLSTSRVAVIYNDSSTFYPTLKTFSVSGTTPTLDVTTTISSSGTSGHTKNVRIKRATSSRVWLMYENSSGYPTVIGANCSSGSTTLDGAAAIVRSNILANSGTVNQCDMALSGTTTGFVVVKTTSTSALEYAPITDSGTALTVGTKVAFGSSDSAQYPFIYCTARSMIVGGYASDTGFAYVHVAQISGATVSVFWPAGGSTFSTGRGLYLPVRWAGYTGNSLPTGAVMGATDNDTVDWYCLPTYYETGDSRRYSYMFIGVDATGEVRNVRFRIHRMSSAWFSGAASDSLAYYSSLTAISPTKVLAAVWDDGAAHKGYVTAMNF